MIETDTHTGLSMLSTAGRRIRLLLILLTISTIGFFAGAHIGTGVGAVLVSFTALILLFCIRKDDALPVGSILNLKVFLALFAVMGVIAFSNFIILYFSVRYAVFDTGIFANLQYRFWNSQSYYSPILQMHGLQDHFTPALIIFTPLLSVWKSFLWLPLLKLISVFSCPFILVLIGREILGRNNPLQYLFPVLWLFDRHIRYLAVTEFQPSTLALPVILAAFLFALRKNYKSLYSALILLVFFKENMTVVWLSVGVFMIVCCREKLRGIQLLCLAPLVTAVIML